VKNDALNALRSRLESELRENILPFWMKYAPDREYGGFHGKISNDLVIEPHAEKGIILNSRILWTFSRAHNLYRKGLYLEIARRAFEYIVANFVDQEFGGTFWTVDYLGQPADTKKRIYGQAFTIYALVEYYAATTNVAALKTAMDIFDLIERKGRDAIHGGYFETYDREWTLADDQRLSAVDQDDRKSMNTHLHVLEAYASLARFANRAEVSGSLRELITIFLDRILDEGTSHFRLFFDEDWKVKSDRISFGHDIEGSWLLCEGAEMLADSDLSVRVGTAAAKMAQAAYYEGVDEDGSLLYEASPAGIVDCDRHWWPQAEAVVGFINAYQLTGNDIFLDAAGRCWQFIDRNLIDKARGEWFWKVSRDGIVDETKPKVDQWKGPYHNGRMCFEAGRRIGRILGTK
jgi:cellobiose epimerase